MVSKRCYEKVILNLLGEIEVHLHEGLDDYEPSHPQTLWLHFSQME